MPFDAAFRNADGVPVLRPTNAKGSDVGTVAFGLGLFGLSGDDGPSLPISTGDGVALFAIADVPRSKRLLLL